MGCVECVQVCSWGGGGGGGGSGGVTRGVWGAEVCVGWRRAGGAGGGKAGTGEPSWVHDKTLWRFDEVILYYGKREDGDPGRSNDVLLVPGLAGSLVWGC